MKRRRRPRIHQSKRTKRRARRRKKASWEAFKVAAYDKFAELFLEAYPPSRWLAPDDDATQD